MRGAWLVVALLLAGCTGETPPDAATTPSATSTPHPSPPTTTPTMTTTGAPTTPPPTPPTQQPPRERFAGCSGSGPVRFNTSPMRLDDFLLLEPYGLMVGGHVTPIDHMYFAPPTGSQRDEYEVRAIADGVIYEMMPRDVNVEQNVARLREWRLDIAHSCTFTSYFDLLTSLDPAIEKAYNETRAKPGAQWRGIPLTAGQLVGRIGAQTLDFGVYDYNVTLPGFVVPEHYEREPWKIHTVDPFPYFDEPVRSELLGKMLRQAEPRAGKIDHDVDSRAVGNWFALGTNGYAGDGRWDYWEGHLALAYDFLDPTQVRFSIGNFSNAPAQFGVVGNAPDPASITVETGLVEVELVRWNYLARNRPGAHDLGPEGVRPGDDIYARNQATVLGVALVQMMEDRLLKVEVFPGKTAADVEGFTDAARLYER